MAQKSLPEQEKYELNGKGTPVSSTPEKQELDRAIADSLTITEIQPEIIYHEEEEFEQDLPPSERKRRSKGGWLTPAVLGMGVGVAVAVGVMHSQSNQNSQKPASAPAPSAAAPAPPASMTVTVASVETTPVANTVTTTGTVAAYNLLPVLPQASGLQIKQVSIEEGRPVKVGQIMAVLDNSVLQTQLSSTQAQLEASLAAVQQKQAGLSQAQAELARAQATLAQAQADRGRAEANLADAKSKQADADRTRKRYEYLAEQGAISREVLESRVTSATSAGEAVRVAQAGIASADANITSAKASIGSAQANINSAKAFLLSAQADVRNNEAKVRQIQTQLGQTQVVAPASGIVVAPSADGRCDGNAAAGTTVASQSIAPTVARVGDTSGNKALFCIIRNGYLELQVKIPETELNKVHLGAPVSISSDADRDIWRGRVREIAPVVDPQTRQATIKVDLPSNAPLKPGMFLKAAIAASMTQALSVPATAVQRQTDGNPIVYLLDGNEIAHVEPVEVGATLGGNKGDISGAKTEIKSGLKLGDRVVVAGAGYLKEGDKVRVVDRIEEQGSGGAGEQGSRGAGERGSRGAGEQGS
ncbi:efflux RND transporter periplasmic adaptor subunit [Aerosakkonema funiforme]|uniref:efflux RND transporter periplasmic adaptor subunit n=1 Tax=Aerosakkonema funiforme TaxID=1246630 RepID=UPI0035BB1A66